MIIISIKTIDKIYLEIKTVNLLIRIESVQQLDEKLEILLRSYVSESKTIDDFILLTKSNKEYNIEVEKYEEYTPSNSEITPEIAKEIGYVKGVKIKSKWDSRIGIIVGKPYWAFGSSCLSIETNLISKPENNYIPIYNRGKWAEILND